jgi:hypothetical protein
MVSFEKGQTMTFKEEIVMRARKAGLVYTHFHDDIDNKVSIELIREAAQVPTLRVEKIPATQIRMGYLNVDVGAHAGSFVYRDTVVVDSDPERGIRSTIHQLSLFDFDVPEALLHYGKYRNNVEPNRGWVLARLTSGAKILQLARANMLDKCLTDVEIASHHLLAEYNKQQGYWEQATKLINEGVVSESLVVVNQFVKGGSALAYSLNYDYYASFDSRAGSFAVTAAPGCTLPKALVDAVCAVVPQATTYPNRKMLLCGIKQGGSLPASVLEEVKKLVKQHLGAIIKKSDGR